MLYTNPKRDSIVPSIVSNFIVMKLHVAKILVAFIWFYVCYVSVSIILKSLWKENMVFINGYQTIYMSSFPKLLWVLPWATIYYFMHYLECSNIFNSSTSQYGLYTYHFMYIWYAPLSTLWLKSLYGSPWLSIINMITILEESRDE